MFERSEIKQAVSSVYKTLESRIIKEYHIHDVEEAEKITDQLLKIHGMDREHFSIIKQVEDLLTGKLNDNSVDDNSNKGEKTIKGILKEASNPIDKIIGYRYLYRKMAEVYGKKEAKYLTSLMYDYTLALSDSTNIMNPYCWAFDSSKLVTMGKPFGQLPSGKVKRLDSYISLLNEVIHQMSNHLAGAIAIGPFFLDIAHLLMINENKTIEDLNNSEYRKYIKNQFQRMIHGVNSLSRSGGVECVTADTEVLTPYGFKGYSELKKGDDIYTWKDGSLNIQKVQRVNIKEFDGEMIEFSGRDINQTVTFNHNVLHKKNNSEIYELKNAEELYKEKTPTIIPIAFNNILNDKDYNISDDLLQLATIVFCDGHFEVQEKKATRISITKSLSRYGIKEIDNLLKKLGYTYSETIREGTFSGCNISSVLKAKTYKTKTYRLSTVASKEICALFNNTKKDIPDWFLSLSKRQSNLVLDTWMKYDGCGHIDGHIKLQCDNYIIADKLQHIAVRAGYGSRITERLIGNNKTATIYLLLYKQKNKSLAKKKKIQYNGIVWCPTTDDGIVIYRKEGKIFISGNSPFTNVSLFDREKLKKLVGEEYAWYYMNDNGEALFTTEQVIDFIIELQNIYMEFFDCGDPLNDGMPYRFPVSTLNISKKRDKNNKWIIEDKKFLKSVCKKDIYRYNIFVSEGNKVASCCFEGSQTILARNSNGEFITTIKDLVENIPNNTNTSIYHNGFWKKFDKVKIDYCGNFIEIITENNKKVIVTMDHKFPTLVGDKKAEDITVDDYIMFSTKTSNKTQKYDSLTYEQGFLIGCFLGDGSYGKTAKGVYTHMQLSLNENCIDSIKEKVDKAISQWGINYTSKKAAAKNNVHPLRIYNTELVNILLYYAPHHTAQNKYFNEALLGHSEQCRKGILDGWYATDGGNSNRCYSVSKKLIDQMETLCTTLGIQTRIDVFDRRDEETYIRGEKINHNFLIYSLRFYDTQFKSKDIAYKWHNNSIFFKIKSVRHIENKDNYAYCVEIKNDEPYFTLANGIISHNCRLLSDQDKVDLASQANSFGAGGSISLGSHRVITINLMRAALQAKDMDDFLARVNKATYDSKKILYAHKEMLKDLKPYQLFVNKGWIQLDRMFSTIGLMGYVEATEVLKKKFKDKRDIMQMMFDEVNNTLAKGNEQYPGCFFNIEQIPGESMCHRLSKSDKLLFGDDAVPFDIYANQIVPLWNKTLSIWDKMEITGKYLKKLSGGGIEWINAGEHITPKQAEGLIDYAVECDLEHFAINGAFCKCEDGHVIIGDRDTCAKCGKPIVQKITRTVGYFVDVADMSTQKVEYDYKRRKEHINGDFESKIILNS
jgi:anaerobic ribonucleoside-triphosphate reductase